MSAFQPVPAPLIYLDTADERPSYVLTPAEQIERRIAARCPAAIREAEREEYMAEHDGEEPPEDDDYEPPPWEDDQ